MYCTVDDILTVMGAADIGQLSNDTGSDEVDTDIVDAVISSVSDQIDSYLRSRYSLPILAEQVPPALRDVAVVLCKYRLWTRRLEDAPQGLKDDKAAALAYLSQVQKGSVILDWPNTERDPHPKTILVSSKPKVFTDILLNRY